MDKIINICFSGHYKIINANIIKNISVCKRLQTQTSEYKPLPPDYCFGQAATLHCQSGTTGRLR
jgi:hypothetical protein